MDADTGAIGQPVAYAGVYDGHGGSATAEWLQERLFNVIRSKWSPGGARGGDYTALVNDAFLEADKQLLSNTSGFMGMGERGVGGAKCGATAAAVMLVPEASGTTSLVTANVGDARILLVRGGKPVQLSEDHVPDV